MAHLQVQLAGVGLRAPQSNPRTHGHALSARIASPVGRLRRLFCAIRAASPGQRALQHE